MAVNRLLVVPRKVQKPVSDTGLVNVGQLHHCVVFGTKFDAAKNALKSALIHWLSENHSKCKSAPKMQKMPKNGQKRQKMKKVQK